MYLSHNTNERFSIKSFSNVLFLYLKEKINVYKKLLYWFVVCETSDRSDAIFGELSACDARGVSVPIILWYLGLMLKWREIEYEVHFGIVWRVSVIGRDYNRRVCLF